MITYEELKERLCKVNEVDLLELLGISSEDIVNRFDDFIEFRYEVLIEDFNNDEEEEYSG